MKLKRLTAALMALSLCAALTACGDDTGSSSYSPSKREEASSAADNKADDDKPGQADSSEDESSAPTAATTEATTTTAATTTQPEVIEFKPLIEAGDEITIEVLEQFIPNIYGLTITEAMDAFITSLNLTTYTTDISMGNQTDNPPEGYPWRWIGEIILTDAPIPMLGMDLEQISVNTYLEYDADPQEDTAVKQYTAEIAFALSKRDANNTEFEEARVAVYTAFNEAYSDTLSFYTNIYGEQLEYGLGTTKIGSLSYYYDTYNMVYDVFLSRYPKKTEE